MFYLFSIKWYQDIKYFPSLVSKCTSVSILIGITNFLFYIVSKSCDISNWFVDLRKIQNLYSLFTIGILKFCLCTNDIKIYLSIITIYVKNVLICIAYIQGGLTSLLYIDSCWVYLILRRLTSLLYVIHVCRRSLTSPVMPRSRGYGDVIVTYIRRSEIPSRIYAKH